VNQAQHDAAAAVIDDLLGDQDAAAQAPPEGQATEQTATEPPAEAPEIDIPNWTADTTGLDFLSEPDEPEDVFSEDEPEDEPEEEPNWDEDADTQKLRSQYKKLEKKLEWERQQRIKASRKQWEAEAARRFPLSDPSDIDADSRRAFMRKAYEQHTRVEKKVKPMLETLEKFRTEIVDEAKAEGRAAAAAAFGSPTTGPPVSAVLQAEHEARVETKRPTGNLYEATIKRFRSGLQI